MQENRAPMHESSSPLGREPTEGRQTLEQEVQVLRREVARLRIEREALLRALTDRDYERPPHWEER